MARKTFWTCSRVTGGIRCGHENPNRKQKCEACGKRRPARRKPAHMKALEQPYEAFVKANGGDWCGVCGAEGSDTRKLDRDHDHVTGAVRGVLCHRHNRGLQMFGDDPVLLAAAIDYLERDRDEQHRAWDAGAAGRRAVEKHSDALARLSDEQGAGE
jgi:hypothetical protein